MEVYFLIVVKEGLLLVNYYEVGKGRLYGN
jgi:hypothetical protein